MHDGVPIIVLHMAISKSTHKKNINVTYPTVLIIEIIKTNR
jgi:hypothetical protein